jgi:hypothetical protein
MLDELQLTYTSYNGQNLNSPAVSVIRGSTVYEETVVSARRWRQYLNVPDKYPRDISRYIYTFFRCFKIGMYLILNGDHLKTTYRFNTETPVLSTTKHVNSSHHDTDIMTCKNSSKSVNNNFQLMHFSYIYYISQYSYMFRSVRAILRELHSKMIKC